MIDKREWQEADGPRAFASGTASGVRTRRSHALLGSSPSSRRVVLLNGWDAWLETPAGTYALSSQAYPHGVEYPNGRRRLEHFEAAPWPTWTWRCEDGTRVTEELFAAHGSGAICVRFELLGAATPARLTLRPFLSGRDEHALHRENPTFRFEPRVEGESVVFSPYPGIPELSVHSNGEYRHQPDWYRQFVYAEERAPGAEFSEDLAAPGALAFDLRRAPAALLLATPAEAAFPTENTEQRVAAFRKSEAARR